MDLSRLLEYTEVIIKSLYKSSTVSDKLSDSTSTILFYPSQFCFNNSLTKYTSASVSFLLKSEDFSSFWIRFLIFGLAQTFPYEDSRYALFFNLIPNR